MKTVDYCDVYLTHDAPRVRRDHNSGWKHAAQVKAHFMEQNQDRMARKVAEVVRDYEVRGELVPVPAPTIYRQGPSTGLAGGPPRPPMMGPPPPMMMRPPPPPHMGPGMMHPHPPGMMGPPPPGYAPPGYPGPYPMHHAGPHAQPPYGPPPPHQAPVGPWQSQQQPLPNQPFHPGQYQYQHHHQRQ